MPRSIDDGRWIWEVEALLLIGEDSSLSDGVTRITERNDRLQTSSPPNTRATRVLQQEHLPRLVTDCLDSSAQGPSPGVDVSIVVRSKRPVTNAAVFLRISTLFRMPSVKWSLRRRFQMPVSQLVSGPKVLEMPHVLIAHQPCEAHQWAHRLRVGLCTGHPSCRVGSTDVTVAYSLREATTFAIKEKDLVTMRYAIAQYAERHLAAQRPGISISRTTAV